MTANTRTRTRTTVNAESTAETSVKGDKGLRQRARLPVTNTESVTTETSFPASAQTAIAEVTIDGSMTYNLGNFNSARMSAQVKLPVMVPVVIEGEEESVTEIRLDIIGDGMDKASAMVQDRLDHEYNSFIGSMTPDQLETFYSAQEA